MWTSWDEFTETWRAWTTWDDWVLAAYRGRINFESFRESPPPSDEGRSKSQSMTEDEKAQILKTHRASILATIKNKNNGEHYHWQAFLHILSKSFVFLIATSSGAVISDIFLSHLGLSGLGYGVGPAIFAAAFASTWIGMRVSVPNVLRRIFEYEGALGWHFLAKNEMNIYRNDSEVVKRGYFKDQTGQYEDTPEARDKMTWGASSLLLLQFGLSAIVGLVLLAQTVDKAKGGLKGLLPFLVGTGVAAPVAWVMGIAGLACMLGQYTYSMIRFLRQKDKCAELWTVFRKAEKGKGDWPEVCVHNVLMGMVVLGLSFFVAMGIYGTSQVQADAFVDLAFRAKNGVAAVALTICTIAGKSLFTVRAMFNFVGILRAVTYSAWSWLWPKENTQAKFSPFDNRKVEDKLTAPEYAAVLTYAAAKSTTAVHTPNPGQTSELFSDDFSDQFFAWVSTIGAFIRAAQEPLDKVRPKQVDKPESVMKDKGPARPGEGKISATTKSVRFMDSSHVIHVGGGNDPSSGTSSSDSPDGSLTHPFKRVESVHTLYS